jgi:hypothetical protein
MWWQTLALGDEATCQWSGGVQRTGKLVLLS